MIFGRLWRSRPAAIDPMPKIVGAFSSLGNNCEFGLVQRSCGVEPLGLFRFSRTELDRLIAALDTDFERYGLALGAG